MGDDRPDLHDLIALIYEAAALGDSARWQHLSAMLGQFHRACVSGIMLFPDPLLVGPVAMAVTGVPESASADYVDEFHRHDLLSHAALAGGGALVRSNEVIDMNLFDRHVFWNEFSRPHTGAWHGMAQGGVGQGHGLMIVCRERGDAQFDAAEERDFQTIRRHLNQALRLSERLTDQRVGQDAFMAMAHAALVIDGSGQLIVANGAAETLLANHGIALAHHRNALPGLGQSGTLRAAIQAVERGEADVVVPLASRLLGAQVFARFAPMPGASGGLSLSRTVVMVTLMDVQAPGEAVSGGLIASLFNLTDAEANVAGYLLQGLTAPQIAAARGVSEPTVRSQLERLVAKTGAANLRECTMRLDRALRL